MIAYLIPLALLVGYLIGDTTGAKRGAAKVFTYLSIHGWLTADDVQEIAEKGRK